MNYSEHASVQRQKRCNLPMKTRRRQSDAKWRANVASCYETLKHIIPVNKRASRRQISKAHIIQQTSNHIKFLEEVMSSLLIEKAKKDGAEKPESWKSEKLEEIKEDFVNQHRKKLEHLNAEKRYKKKSYKLFIADENIQENVQQTAQLREALFQSHKEITCPQIIERSEHMESKINHVLSGMCDAVPSETVQDMIDCSLDDGAVDLRTTNTGMMSTEYTEEIDQPIDYSLNELPEALDLTVHKTAGVSLDIVHSTQNAAISQFGGCMFAPNSDGLMETGSFHFVPEVTFTEQSNRKDNQFDSEAKNIPDHSDNQQLVPQSSAAEISGPCDPMVQSLNNQPRKTPVKRLRETGRTPRKLQKTGDTTGFTPVKLPSSWCCSKPDENTEVYVTPVKTWNNRSLDTVDLHDTSVDSDVEALVCTEVWMSSDDETPIIDERLQHTPCRCSKRMDLRNLKRARHERTLRQRLPSVSSLSSDSCVKDSKQGGSDQEVPGKKSLSGMKCRRSLQGLYDSEVPSDSPRQRPLDPTESEASSPNQDMCSMMPNRNAFQSETLDFDRYYLFYKKMGAQFHRNLKPGVKEGDQLVSDEMSRLIYESWTKLPHGQKNGLKQLALTEPNSQDSGFCKSPKNMKELDDLDNEIWPLPADMDLNATDECNIFSPDPMIADVETLLNENMTMMSTESENLATACHSDAKSWDTLASDALPSDTPCASQLAPVATIQMVQLGTRPHSESKVAENINQEAASQEIQPMFILDSKDLFSAKELVWTTDEVHRYFADFSPPMANKLSGLH